MVSLLSRAMLLSTRTAGVYLEVATIRPQQQPERPPYAGLIEDDKDLSQKVEGVHRLETPTAGELALALKLAKRYPDSGAEIPDLIVMAMASQRRARVLTWDFRHFRAVVLRRGHHWPLVVDESKLPAP